VSASEFHLEFDSHTPLREGGTHGHNRWHPDIPPVAKVAPGTTVVFRTREGSDGQIGRDAGVAEFMKADTDVIHTLTGPFFVEGAEPGGLLRVEVVDIASDDHGITLIWPGSGFGMLPDDDFEHTILHWDISGGHARSEALPGVTIPGAPFLGVMGVAPSHERLARISTREARLAAEGFGVIMPSPTSAFPAGGAPAAEGLRTAPPREIGGNMDIKQLRAGSVVTFPVDVPGALFSAGDCHFAQGDGEATGTAIEITATVKLRFGVVKRDDAPWHPRYPSFEYTEQPVSAPRRWVGTTGIPIDRDGRNGFMDLTLCAREAIREMIDYLVSTRGLTREQAYILVSVAGDLKISEGVDVPNPLVSVHLPLDVFDAERQE
jgi:formamidase